MVAKTIEVDGEQYRIDTDEMTIEEVPDGVVKLENEITSTRHPYEVASTKDRGADHDYVVVFEPPMGDVPLQPTENGDYEIPYFSTPQESASYYDGLTIDEDHNAILVFYKEV